MDFRVPELGEGVYEAELVEWSVKPGDEVRQGQVLAEVVTDKATMELPAPFLGTIETLIASPGDKIEVRQVVLTYTPGEGSAEATADVAVKAVDAAAPARSAGEYARAANSGRAAVATAGGNGPAPSVRAAPSVRRMARSLGIDLTQMRGSGHGGRVLINDLTAVLQAGQVPSPHSPPPPPGLPVGRPGTRVKVVGRRRTIAENMLAAKRTIPHYSYIDECDVTQLVQLRRALKDTLAVRHIKLTYLAFIAKAVVHALKEVPIVNASLDDVSGEIVLHDEYHIGIATATEKGLVVPVIHHADRYSVAGLAREIQRLGSSARADELTVDELRGGTFTVSSVGNVGGMVSTPIINHPEVGILGLGKVFKRPVYDEAGRIVPAQILYLSFSFDHRVVDGAVGATFGNAVKRQLVNPAALLIGDSD